MINYFVHLIFNIYISAFYTAKTILFESKSEIAIVDAKTQVKGKIYQTLVANSITLTPGTVTVDKNNSVLTVLCFNPKSDTKNLGQQILNPFESLIKKGK